MSLDLREFKLIELGEFQVTIIQRDVLRVIKALRRANCSALALKFKRMIFVKDYYEKTVTDFKVKVGSNDIIRETISPLKYVELRNSQRYFDAKMEEYYEKNKLKKGK
jgi:hypothetical protein